MADTVKIEKVGRSTIVTTENNGVVTSCRVYNRATNLTLIPGTDNIQIAGCVDTHQPHIFNYADADDDLGATNPEEYIVALATAGYFTEGEILP